MSQNLVPRLHGTAGSRYPVSQDEQRRQLAEIFAAGAMRLRGSGDVITAAAANRPNSVAPCLDVSPETVLSVPTG
jgi:hypothetical protein